MIILLITIYGFLLSSYQGSKEKLIENKSIISDLNNQINKFNGNIDVINENIRLLTKKYDIVNNKIEHSSGRLDTLYNRKSYSTAKQVENIISNYNIESMKISTDIELYRSNKIMLMDSINILTYKIDKLNIETTNSDIGPIKYIADMIEIDIDIIINYFIFIIIFVFDPMAIIMFIAFNKYNNHQTSIDNDTIIGSSNDNGEFEISFTNERV